ncbi:MAG TPA: S8 family serine peptidase [Urbifossiella sp.]|nr:S8 family serine peptidase [Urbifossiella sp.]
MEMMILRRRGGGGGLEATNIPVSAGPRLEALVQDLPPSSVRDLHRDDDVLGAAQPMPLTLIQPVAHATTAAAAADGVAWGISAVGAASSPFTGKGLTVAVLDTGIDAAHPAFAGVEVVARNFTTAGGEADVTDTHGHGTHCAGTIFGREVNGTRIGVAPGVTRAVIGKVLGPGGGSTGTLVSAINWAIEKKAQVVSVSLGMDLVGFRDRLTQDGMHPKQATSTAMRVLIDNVRFFDKFGNMLRSGGGFGRGALVVAASGNESDRFGDAPFVLGAAYPAATEDFLSVGALERTGDEATPYRVATFSNAGARLAGPGVDVLSAAPGGGLQEMSGTSMATPHVAGVAALWAQKLMLHGAPTAEELLFSLRSSAVVPPGLDVADVGFGIPQAPRA